MGKIIPVLLSGGTGSRLWPLSRQNYPKQLLRLTGRETLLQQAAERVSDRSVFEAPIVVANAQHRFTIAEQLREIGISDARIVLEPASRNTAPASAAAALVAIRQQPEAILLITPTDHAIENIDAFRAAIAKGIEWARKGLFVLFAIRPSAPETGFGYIHLGQCLEPDDVCEVRGFREKPDLATAEQFFRSGAYAWNSGIFLLSAQRLLNELATWEPALLNACEHSVRAASADLDFLRLESEAFSRATDISLDHAVLERTHNMAAVLSPFSWHDIGSWSAIWGREHKDGRANVVSGQVFLQDTEGSYIRSEGPLIATMGIRNLIVVATSDAILVAERDHAQDVRKLVDDMKGQGLGAAIQTAEAYRPWGSYRCLHGGEGFLVKHIRVNPGARLSLQKHYHRSEHWVVVRGQALVTRDRERLLLRENESIDIPCGCIHRLENSGSSFLDLIEVQSGAHLSEDDIVRLEDDYARL
ncbi:mannose-1-phosphate guanylyltransferase/mannose-6-phosphate isomerase [Microvirga puerhi]|uniref:mannose-1-phosphate guanylyltransferase n=1 Tax=Microvirga puerhi TaxID=2876078 RepID=A0ABS7VS25_9HYPH|nr:mannose-1-phosphate guanylyltransferase/mannose-6-phosphate isomerase [Microvirga puerhi]MBZ6078366.1 mannose-1-phosphate guanylyltransferase/mannose-6-phosphate isomerase [Microvirga puerhi]